TPNEAGVSIAVIQHFSGKIPILGICLGMQSIGQAFGGKIVHAKRIMHAKISDIYHDGKNLFKGLPNPFRAVRYNSLVIDPATLPECLKVTAWTQAADGELEDIMGVHHQQYLVTGVQFHPESLMSEHGDQIFSNFLQLCHEY